MSKTLTRTRSRWGAISAALAAVAVTGTAGTYRATADSTVPSPSSAPSTPASTPAPAPNLKGACPDNVVIQSDWWPEAEYGHLYNLIGDGYTVDTERKAVHGKLVAGGQDTGVTIELRAGGGAIQGSASAELVNDPKVIIAQANIEGIATNKDVKLLAVAAPIESNPQMIMWDPATYPDVKTIADLKAKGVRVLVFGKGTVAKWAIGKGLMTADQLDTSFDGSAAQFIAAEGKLAQQGFSTSEPFTYPNVQEGWKKPVAFQTWYDAGFETYSQTLTILADRKAELAPCLKLLVPIVQRSQVEYAASPERANAMIVDVVAKYDNFWKQTPELVAYSHDKQLELGVIGTGANETLGDMDPARVTKVVEELRSTPELDIGDRKAEDMYTNEFVDMSVTWKKPG